MHYLLLLFCKLRLHRWRSVFVDGQPHIKARLCGRCDRHERLVGTWWAPCSKDWGFLPEVHQ